MKIKDLLPIGSIVVLNEGEKRLMISGIMQSDVENPDKEYDYMGLLYPEGNIGDQFQYLFNHSDIAQIVFRGFEDEERTEFLKRLANFYPDK